MSLIPDVQPATVQSATVKSADAAGRIVVEVNDLEMHFTRSNGEQVRAVDGVSVTVQDDEILVLLGPSGCGKTTLLRSIAGLEEPSAGSITVDGKVVFDAAAGVTVPPNKRDVNMMFQSYALWPHMTLEDNVAYPLRMAGKSRQSSRARAEEYLELVGLGGLGKQFAGQISGGQQQRAALARTLISEPAVVLFDEPLSNVDAKVRNQLRAELLRLHRELKFAAVYVTHDQIEAMTLGTRIAVMEKGKVAQLDTPVEIYERPTTEYVAKFIGAATILDGSIVSATRTEAVVATDIGEVRATVDGSLEHHPGDAVQVMVRPEQCTLGGPAASSTNVFDATVDSVVYSGAYTEYRCLVAGRELVVARQGSPAGVEVGDAVSVHVPEQYARVIG